MHWRQVNTALFSKIIQIYLVQIYLAIQYVFIIVIYLRQLTDVQYYSNILSYPHIVLGSKSLILSRQSRLSNYWKHIFEEYVRICNEVFTACCTIGILSSKEKNSSRLLLLCILAGEGNEVATPSCIEKSDQVYRDLIHLATASLW